MLSVLDSLFINICMVIALGYLLSLTYTDWRPEKRVSVLLFRTAFASTGSILLMYHGIDTQHSLIDLRLVPLLLVTLRYGLSYGLLATFPLLMVRAVFFADQPILPVMTSIGLSLMTVALIRLSFKTDVVPARAYRQAPLLAFLVSGLGVAGATPAEQNLFLWAFPWYYVANVLGFWGAARIVRSRMKYLQATEHLQKESLMDPLTGLLNRRQFELDRPLFEAGDAFLVLDLDHFKKVNDTYGHSMGDEVLKQSAALLKSATRAYDRIYRMGGEEFLVVLRNTMGNQAESIAERIRLTIESHLYPVPRQVTVSGGLVVLHPLTTLQAVMELADELLYHAKAQGRNQIQSEGVCHKGQVPKVEVLVREGGDSEGREPRAEGRGQV
ncbi:GGDEF domain-containing protein [Deinococcus roseus]|uniref:GGDEF domain-containing protein n=1 Tax=Deinococcus roseus TaxID=392414 RepID=A0ABQ2D0Q0_9DEIO|nr:GGDEF domain-containing protein [Deinococcus roseus]GGJ39525.1 GGDEF domain-containing protein [Deinococcus roseus]